MKNMKDSTLTMMLSAILVLLIVTPLGFTPIGPINATTTHIPVVIISIILGPRLGALLGGTFGLISMIRSTVTQTPLSFVSSPSIPVARTRHGNWKALLIAFTPWILIGVVPYSVYNGLHKLMKQEVDAVSSFLAGLASSLTNTILVMNMIYFLFQQDYIKVIGTNLDTIYSAILAVIFTGGVPEGVVAGLATAAACNALLRYFRRPSLHH